MDRQTLVGAISVAANVPSKEVAKVIETAMDIIKTCVANGEDITLRGFGVFKAKERKEKVARNISKNTSMIIPAHYTPYFKAYPEFKNEVRSKREVNHE